MIGDFIINLGIALRFLAIVIFVVYILPKQWQEALIKDSLSLPRWLIFYGLIACFVIMLITVGYNFYRQFPDRPHFEAVMNFVAITASLKDLIIAAILVLLYKKQYTE